MHEGVGVLISNQTQDLFFVQEKDQFYPIQKWVGAYSFWGGKKEAQDENTEKALIRELEEELTHGLNFKTQNFTFSGTFTVKSDHHFIFHLFVLNLNEVDFQTVSNSTVREGRGVIVSKAELINGNWIWDLEQVIKSYFFQN